MGCKCSDNKPEEDEIINEDKEQGDYNKLEKFKNEGNQIVISNTNFKNKNRKFILSKIYVKNEEKKKIYFNISDSNEMESDISENKSKNNQNNISNEHLKNIKSNYILKKNICLFEKKERTSID